MWLVATILGSRYRLFPSSHNVLLDGWCYPRDLGGCCGENSVCVRVCVGEGWARSQVTVTAATANHPTTITAVF